MSDAKVYTVGNVFDGISRTFHQYLEAQYHIWDESLIAERRTLLQSPGVTYQLPRLEATPFYPSAPPFQGLNIPDAAKKILSIAGDRKGTGIFAEPYEHQAQSLEKFLTGGSEVIVATGTGSGKTESFLMPILGSLAIEAAHRQDSWNRPGIRALLLYPMNALVNDQLARLRRLFGDETVAEGLRGARTGRATFAMYTSRTPYAGNSTPAKDRERIGHLLDHLFNNLSDAAKSLLREEGKWPAKDLHAFVASGFKTGKNDSELYTRQEVRTRAPDLLVTNYSMLEYMLLRPIERPIFEQTAKWLAEDSQNKFTVVLDEAHMYRGSSGAEVAYLLRRLHSRLGVPRDRIRYILTSASLGQGEAAERKIKKFAADLTGLTASQPEFVLVAGKPLRKDKPRVATHHEAKALAAFDISAIHNLHSDDGRAVEVLRELFVALDVSKTLTLNLNVSKLRDAAYTWICDFGPAALASNLLSERPETVDAVASLVFPGFRQKSEAMESLVSLMSFARSDASDKVFAPVRSHLFFKGLPGLFVCVNPRCTERRSGVDAALGKAFAEPTKRCACGGRVYELLTHRDCGAAFLRGYLNQADKDFLWHEPSKGVWSDRRLMEVHLVVEVARHEAHQNSGSIGTRNWLHIATGRLQTVPPASGELDNFIPVVRANSPIQEKGKLILTFDRECPVCLKTWQGKSKIMDLATKGEAPFAHLIREQVALQPATRKATPQSPNGGRKSLLFSDGRQKAARLARDIPREIEQDVFRQIFLMAANTLTANGYEATLGRWTYIAFLHVLANADLQLFDSGDRHEIHQAIDEYKKWYDGSLEEALRTEFDPKPPPRYQAHLLRQLGSRFYSVSALTLGFVRPTEKALKAILSEISPLKSEELLPVAVVWLQGVMGEFSFDASIAKGVRLEAAGHPLGAPACRGFTKRQEEFLATRGIDVKKIHAEFLKTLTNPDSNGFRFVNPTRVRLEVAVHKQWFQCASCTAVSAVAWWGFCSNCLEAGVSKVDPDTSPYLRARKGFWRDPVVRVLDGTEVPINLNVEEHTAQLSYRDSDQPSNTTEEFERRFKDILVRDSDVSIDVLSSTTTMEVGIDIGSLVAVGLRNIPPLRQNYQQRAGRAGRRGSSVSTVVTYAQNSPHDSHYFLNPERIISGAPTMPSVDTANRKIIERHVRAQLVHSFFKDHGGGSTGNVFSMLGDTWEFFTGKGDFTLEALRKWIDNSQGACSSFSDISEWLPPALKISPKAVAEQFVDTLMRQRPINEDALDQSDEYLIEFLFSHGHLPSYAFPRDLCALQIERETQQTGRPRVGVLQRPQQGLNIALTEYAPGRLVVVNKKTYRVGTVASGGASSEVNRAERLFEGRRTYVHCDACLFTAGFAQASVLTTKCPLCPDGILKSVTVIQPEVVFPEGGKEVDEFDDEQIFSQATSAQLPLPEGSSIPVWHLELSNARLAVARDQPMVMVNKGADSQNGDESGFLVCSKCGKTSLDGLDLGPHARDYKIALRPGVIKPSFKCSGDFERVFLGYAFASDILLLRISISKSLRFDPIDNRFKFPISDALQSLCEAIVLGISQQLDIDIREISAGFRFVRQGDSHFADVFVFDTLAGGAGYATMAGDVFRDVLEKSHSLLSSCTCGTSCDKCLRHYGNRFHHSSLDRFLALEILDFVRDGELRPALSVAGQRTELRDLADLLELAGWVVDSSSHVPLAATKDGRTVEIFSMPSLRSPNSLGWLPAKDKYIFTPYEIAKDLPGAYAEVS